MSNNGAFRRKKIHFSQVSNEALRDINLSLKAKGLYGLIQSYTTLEDFTLYKTTLKKSCKEKDAAFDNAWKELKDNGYLIQYKLQDEKGNFYYEYELLDIKNDNFNHPPKNHPMDNPYSGEVGVYNYTDSNNTYIEEEETFQEVINLYSSVKDSKTNSYDHKILSELSKLHGGLITLEAIKMMAERAEKPNLKYLKSTLEDWKSKGLDTIEKIELHFAKEKVLKEDAKKNNHQKLERAAKGSFKVKQDSFNSYDQRPRTAEELEEIAKATRGNEEVEEITNTPEWVKRMRNKNKEE